MVYPKHESYQASLSQVSSNEHDAAAQAPQSSNSVLKQEVEMNDCCDPLVLAMNEESSDTSYNDNLIELDMSVTTKPFEDVNIPGEPGHHRRLTSEEMLSQWNYYRVLTKLGTQYQCLQFAMERGLIPKIKMCTKHKKPMSLKDTGVHGLGYFICNKYSCGRRRVSRARGTFLENCHLKLALVFQLIYLYSHNFSHEQARHETTSDEKGTVLSTATVVDWYTFFRDTIVTYEMEHQTAQEKIGGPNKIVRIGQSKYGKFKKIRGQKSKQYCVIGMFEEGPKDLRFEVYPGIEICTENLVPIIKKHVHEGSIIQADYSKEYYSSLSKHGFVCGEINNSTDCKNGNMDINGTETSSKSLESQWARLGKAYKNDPHVENFADWMVVNMWRHKVKTLRKDPFEELLNVIKYVYNPN